MLQSGSSDEALAIGSLRFEPVIDAGSREQIDAKLSQVEADFGVRFLFAVESGSRAWGFPSPDSDYDVRFVYAHEQDWYLSIHPGRDVIELPIEGELDINGWDIRKALGLLLKPNPVLLEWLSSPIRYRWDSDACEKLSAFANAFVRPAECTNHYFHLAKRQWERHIEGETNVNLKKYFYVLRPALALRWVRMNPDVLPPMNFQALVNGTGISMETQQEFSELLRAKSMASEVGLGARLPELDKLILDEMQWVSNLAPVKPTDGASAVQAADQLFRELIK